MPRPAKLLAAPAVVHEFAYFEQAPHMAMWRRAELPSGPTSEQAQFMHSWGGEFGEP
jgi:hypothetical protein